MTSLAVDSSNVLLLTGDIEGELYNNYHMHTSMENIMIVHVYIYMCSLVCKVLSVSLHVYTARILVSVEN